MTAYELADWLEKFDWYAEVITTDANGYQYADYDCQTSLTDEVAVLIRKLQFENDAFRKELFNRGSMDSCSRSAHNHGFVSPAQAGDDAREYIAKILKKASEK